MTGGFYSAEDADSIIEHGKKEHAEGAFYVWTSNQIEEIITDPKELKGNGNLSEISY